MLFQVLETNTDDLIYRLRKRAEIRRNISTRKSVQEGKPDRISDILEEAAARIEALESRLAMCEDFIRYYENRKESPYDF